MIVEYARSFDRDLKKIQDKGVKMGIMNKIIEIEEAQSIYNIHNLKKLKGYSSYYRIRVQGYRIGFEYIKPNILLITVLKRKKFYKHFPPNN